MVSVETYKMMEKYYFVIRDKTGMMLHSSKLYPTKRKARIEGMKYKKKMRK